MESDNVENQEVDNPAIVLCGIDLVEYVTFQRCVEVGAERFLARTYTEAERDYCQERVPCLGARYAVKEAVSKALGTGFRGVRPIEIETRNSPQGKPMLTLSGSAAMLAEELGIEHWEISLSHENSYAVAIAVAVKKRSVNIPQSSLLYALQDALGKIIATELPNDPVNTVERNFSSGRKP